MTLRKLNYTGRQKIPRHCAAFNIQEGTDGENRFDLDLSLGSTKFADESLILVEAYNRDLSKQFLWGTVSKPVAPQDNMITSLGVPADIKFRLKIVGPVDDGNNAPKILGRADGLVPNDGSDDDQTARDSIISVRPASLGAIAWKLSYPDDLNLTPILMINKAIPKAIVKLQTDPVYMALILPSVVREVFMKIAESVVGGEDDENPRDNPDSWPMRWIRFAETEMGDSPLDWETLDDFDRVESYIDEVVQNVSQFFDLLGNLLAHEAKSRS
ncbi:MAG: hypothetical protein QF473_14135 [Planctomycetota bacterium]|nr:hypothetical protein [Planctomycetota bacterium]